MDSPIQDSLQHKIASDLFDLRVNHTYYAAWAHYSESYGQLIVLDQDKRCRLVKDEGRSPGYANRVYRGTGSNRYSPIAHYILCHDQNFYWLKYELEDVSKESLARWKKYISIPPSGTTRIPHVLYQFKFYDVNGGGKTYDTKYPPLWRLFANHGDPIHLISESRFDSEVPFVYDEKELILE